MGTRLSTFLPDPTWAFFTTYQVGYTLPHHADPGRPELLLPQHRPPAHLHREPTLTYSTVNHPFKPTAGQKIGVALRVRRLAVRHGRALLPHHPGLRQVDQPRRAAHLRLQRQLRLRATTSATATCRIWDLYRPGGENSIRGYRFGQVGSAQLDNNLQQWWSAATSSSSSTLEYQFKIADAFRTVLFYDMGDAWAQGIRSSSTRPCGGAPGVEFRFFLPISPAPLRLIWARKLNPYPFDTKGRPSSSSASAPPSEQPTAPPRPFVWSPPCASYDTLLPLTAACHPRRPGHARPPIAIFVPDRVIQNIASGAARSSRSWT